MNRSPRGFTLIELLTVIAILGLLIGILLPSLSAARRSAKANVCLSHLKGIGTAFAIYLNENEDVFPPAQLSSPQPNMDALYVNEYGKAAPRWQWFLTTDFGPVVNTTPYRWAITSGGYFQDTTLARPGAAPGTTMTVELFTCPALDDEEFKFDIRDGAFGYNYQYLGNARNDAVPDRWDNFPVPRHRLRSAGSTILVADSRGAGRRHGRHSFTLDPPRLAVEVGARRFGPSSQPYRPGDPNSGDLSMGLDPAIYAYSPMEPRHNDSGNVLFLDGHAESKTLRDLGYQFAADAGIPKETPLAIGEPTQGSYTADNRLWNGEGSDSIAAAHKPTSGP